MYIYRYSSSLTSKINVILVTHLLRIKNSLSWLYFFIFFLYMYRLLLTSCVRILTGQWLIVNPFKYKDVPLYYAAFILLELLFYFHFLCNKFFFGKVNTKSSTGKLSYYIVFAHYLQLSIKPRNERRFIYGWEIVL